MNCLRGGIWISKRVGTFRSNERLFSKLRANARGRKSSSGGRSGDGDKSDDAKKQAAYQDLCKHINDKYGKGTIMRLSDKPISCPKISSGLLSLDFILGGGVPVGRIIEIFGPEGSGKTSLAVQFIAAFEKSGGNVAYLDVENALAIDFCKNIGVSDNLSLIQPASGEEAFDIVSYCIRQCSFKAICVDSVAALQPIAEIESEMGDQHMAPQARLMSKGMRNVTNANGSISEVDGCSLIFINQLRSKIGTIYGNPEVRPGGKALPYHSSIILDLRVAKKVFDDNKKLIGHVIKVKTIKNKIAAPGAEAFITLYYGQGFCKYGSLLDAALEKEVIEQSGAWYNYGTEKLGQGREKVIERLKADPAFAEKIENLTKAAFEEAKGLTNGHTPVTHSEEMDAESQVSEDGEQEEPGVDEMEL